MMKMFCGKGISGLLALTILATAGGTARAEDGTGFGNESDAARIGYDAFNLSVRKRLAATRVGLANRTFADRAFSSGRAFAAAPSSRTGTVAGARRRQIDCVYHTGFTIWGDYHQTWARQSNRNIDDDIEDGYSYRHSAPALGVDWSNGNFTAGIAGTYGWGKLKSRQYDNERNVRAWGLQAYAQYDTAQFYANATFGYAHNRYRASGGGTFNVSPNPPLSPNIGAVNYDSRYSGNSWNADAEFGYKFRFGGARLVPNVGIRYFHDRTGDFAIQNTNYLLSVSDRNYHTLELPVGLDFAYEIAAGGTLLIPHLRAAWVPELSRKRTGWTGTLYEKASPYRTEPIGENTARRSRHGFEIGAGLEAKLTKSLSAHVDYEFGFRSKAQEHHLNVGLGFTF